jgi:hypothetical protein
VRLWKEYAVDPARYPNGVIIALPPDGNFDPHVCPITGRDFRKQPYTENLEEKMNK